MPEPKAPEQAAVKRPYTSKQMGDACEMLIAAELTLAGVPAMKAPDFWPGYDVVAETARGVQRISVKSRTFKHGAAFVRFNEADPFDWLAIVILPAAECPRRRIFIVPAEIAKKLAMTTNAAGGGITRDFQVDKVATKLAAFEDNFALERAGVEFIPENGGGAEVRLRKPGLAKERSADDVIAATDAFLNESVDTVSQARAAQRAAEQRSDAHPKPVGPATDAIERMETEIAADQKKGKG